MKKLIYLFILAAFAVSCQNNKNYTISGTVAGDEYEGTNVYMQQMTDDAMVNTDTAVVVNGKFSFEGLADASKLRFVAIDESVNPRNENRVPVLLEPGKVTVEFDSLVTLSGKGVNKAYNDFRVGQRELISEIREIVGRMNEAGQAGTLTDELEKEISEEYKVVNDRLVEHNYNFVNNNINNELGQHVFTTAYSMFQPEQQKELIDKAGEEFKSKPSIKRIADRLANLENVAIGKKFVDFTLKDMEGNEVSLSDYAGKGEYVLIDFWAAWCGPCRREMPNVVAAYDKYKLKGLEVVGVSFDRDYESWAEGVSELNMTWPQMSDLLYWDSPVVDLYAIRGIPHTVLLDKEGVIIEKDLRGEELDAKLAELLQ